MATKKVTKISKVGAAGKAAAKQAQRDADKEIAKKLEKSLKAADKVVVDLTPTKLTAPKPKPLVKPKPVIKKVRDETPPFEVESSATEQEAQMSIAAALARRGMGAQLVTQPLPVTPKEEQQVLNTQAPAVQPSLVDVASGVAPATAPEASIFDIAHRLTKTDLVRAQGESEYVQEMQERNDQAQAHRTNNTVSMAELGITSSTPPGVRQPAPSQLRPSRERPQNMTMIDAIIFGGRR